MDDKNVKKLKIPGFVSKLGIVFVLIALVILWSCLSSAFFTVNNMLLIVKQVSMYSICLLYTSGQPNLASNMMMDTLTAVVLGGTAMSGGEGSIAGSVMGALLLTIISNGLTINGVNSFWQMIISALILIATIIARRKKD